MDADTILARMVGNPRDCGPFCALEEFLALARTMRARLGTRAYVLDCYLTSLLSVVPLLPEEKVQLGFEQANELQGVCIAALEGQGKWKNHSFYPLALQYVRTHPLPFQERGTKVDLCYTALFPPFMAACIQRLTNETLSAIDRAIDGVELRAQNDELKARLGPGDFMRLAACFSHAFIPLPYGEQIAYGGNIALSHRLLQRDKETSSTLLQLALGQDAAPMC